MEGPSTLEIACANKEYTVNFTAPGNWTLDSASGTAAKGDKITLTLTRTLDGDVTMSDYVLKAGNTVLPYKASTDGKHSVAESWDEVTCKDADAFAKEKAAAPGKVLYYKVGNQYFEASAFIEGQTAYYTHTVAAAKVPATATVEYIVLGTEDPKTPVVLSFENA